MWEKKGVGHIIGDGMVLISEGVRVSEREKKRHWKCRHEKQEEKTTDRLGKNGAGDIAKISRKKKGNLKCRKETWREKRKKNKYGKGEEENEEMQKKKVIGSNKNLIQKDFWCLGIVRIWYIG